MVRLCKLIFVFVAVVSFLSMNGSALGAESINYRLKWLFNMSVAGDLVANESGLFNDAGLEVNVKAGGPERDAIKELELGYAQFGVASADQVILALSKGAPVIVLAQFFQINPLQWIYRANKFRFNSVEDLKGRIIGVTFGGNDETIMKTLLAKGNIKDNQVKLYSVRYDYTPFYQGKVDIWPVYRNSQAIFVSAKLKEAGEQVGTFNPEENGVKFVANSVVTSEKFYREKPKVVENFMKALLEGWALAFDPENKAQTVESVKKYDKDTAVDTIAAQFDVTQKLVQPDPAVPIGTIDKDGWMQTEQIMLQQKVIPKPVNVHKVLKPAN